MLCRNDAGSIPDRTTGTKVSGKEGRRKTGDWDGIYEGEERFPLPLDPLPFQRSRMEKLAQFEGSTPELLGKIL
jgi:hypothetical protein